jgi:DNA-binding NtrC family response regulator
MPSAMRERRDGSALIVAADPRRRAQLGRWVAQSGFGPTGVESAEKSRAALRDGRFDLVLAELAVLDAEGLELFEDLDASAAAVTGECAEPLDGESRWPALARFGRLVGRSAAMQRVYHELLRVASTDATVFLIGESGTGKEIAAEAIHALSGRRAKAFLPVNCGALSPGLVESELFGHERGSFTGADRRRVGLFERAEGGTLFLDEITEMPLELQVKLLRVLESGRLCRVGGDRVIDVDVRVIAATNRDPEEAVAQGCLRADLYYRLMVFPVALPPLRRRPDDIEAIADHYLERLNRGAGTDKSLSEAARAKLLHHAWPGNARELRNAIHRAFILGPEAITSESLPLRPLGRGGGDGADGKTLGIEVGMTVAEAERRLLLATLERAGGNKKRAAEILGISVKTVYSRLSVYQAGETGEGRRSS